jgi:hypothetical protein
MTTVIQVSLPESLRQFAEEVAAKQNISLDQLVASALSDKIDAINSPGYLEWRAKRGSEQRYREIMAKVPADQPLPGDEL